MYGVESGDKATSLSLLTDHLYLTMSNRTLVMNKFTGAVENTLLTGSARVSSTYHPALYMSRQLQGKV